MSFIHFILYFSRSFVPSFFILRYFLIYFLISLFIYFIYVFSYTSLHLLIRLFTIINLKNNILFSTNGKKKVKFHFLFLSHHPSLLIQFYFQQVCATARNAANNRVSVCFAKVFLNPLMDNAKLKSVLPIQDRPSLEQVNILFILFITLTFIIIYLTLFI